MTDGAETRVVKDGWTLIHAGVYPVAAAAASAQEGKGKEVLAGLTRH